MQIVVDGLITSYDLRGKGQLILLLHGWGDSLKGMSNLAKNLSDSYSVLSLDLPGFGSTQPPAAVWDLDDYARFVDMFLTKLGQPQPYAVVGHSNGGALAVRAVSLEVLRPQKLVLLAASGVRTNNRLKRLMLNFVAKVGNLATLWMPERYRQALRKSLYGVAGSDMLVVPELQETFKKTVRQDVQADAAAIDKPTLLVFARDDEAIPVSDGRQYHSLIRRSQLELIDRAGHFVHHDQPDQVTRLIRQFLK